MICNDNTITFGEVFAARNFNFEQEVAGELDKPPESSIAPGQMGAEADGVKATICLHG
jgi:hypothetical protein